MEKIESLTREQEAAMLAFRDEWLTIGRSTEPADRKRAESVFASMYAALGKPAPYVWWCDGPAVGSIVRTLLKQKGDNLRANLGANLWDNLGANLRANLGANLRDNLWDNLRDNLGANLWDNLRDNLWDNLRDNLGANLRDNLWDNLRDNLWDNLSWGFWGAHESAWPAYYLWPHATLRSMHTENEMERLQWWVTLSQSCGWWEPFEGVVFACERPLEQHIDSEGRLHHLERAALLCRDGWPVYAVHGVRVPADIIEDRTTITVARIETETNAEIRRVMIDLYGPKRYLEDSGAVVVHELPADHPIKGLRTARLLRKEVPGDETIIVLDVLNSTPEPDGTVKRYQLRCDPKAYDGEASTHCHAAAASTWRLRNPDGSIGPPVFKDWRHYQPAFES